MNRRSLLRGLATLPCVPWASIPSRATAESGTAAARATRRVRPGDPSWPDADAWAQLGTRTRGRLLKVSSPVDACAVSPRNAACNDVVAQLGNPFFIGDNPALTQTSGWLDAWRSMPSAYAVAAETSADVSAAVGAASAL